MSIALALSLLALPAAHAQDPLPAARVVVPWDDFQDLYERGMAPKDPPEPSPQDAVMSKAVYSGRIEGEAALLDVRLTVDVLKAKGWVVVPLLPTTVALREARLGGADAPVFVQDGWYTLVTDRKGTLNLDLDIAASVWESQGEQGFAFALAPSGASEVALSVPGDDALDVEIKNAQQVVQTGRPGERRIQALLPSSGHLSVSWQREAAEVEAATARLYAEHHALVGLAEGLMQVHSQVQYSILHKGTDALALSLPAGTTVVDVQGKGLRDWSLKEENGRQRIDARLSFEAEGSYTLLVDYEQRLPEGNGAAVVPDLQVLGVERVKGYVGIDARSSLEVSPGPLTGAGPVDVRDLPPAILGQTDWPVLYGFKTTKAEYAIPLDIRVHAPVELLVTLIDQASATTVITPDGKRMTQVVYAMRNNQAQFLRLALPEGATPWSTYVAGRSVKPGRAEDGRVLIPLTRSQTQGGELAQFAVELVYVEDGQGALPGQKSHFEAELPQADVPATGVAWTVYLPREAKLRRGTVDSTLRPVRFFTTIPVPGQVGGEPAQVVQDQANAVFEGEAMAQGIEPVRVTLPLDGEPFLTEKLLVYGDPLELAFDWRAARDP